MQSDSLHLFRRAYEIGRLRVSLVRAAFVTVPLAVVALIVTGAPALVWLPVTFASWVLAQWRGGPVLRGTFFGLVAGIVTYALPLSILRPCCSPERMAALAPGADCCTMPGACLGAGALIGFALAAFVPLGAARVRTAAGMGLGIVSVAILRCSTLFLGEALGLLGGLLAGVVAAALAQAFVRRSAA
jgi:hypothetical protein